MICLPGSPLALATGSVLSPAFLPLGDHAVGLDHLERVLQEPGRVAEGETLLRLRLRGERQRDAGAERDPGQRAERSVSWFSPCVRLSLRSFLGECPGMLVLARNRVKSTTSASALDTEVRTPKPGKLLGSAAAKAGR